jgi:hypothetical protein
MTAPSESFDDDLDREELEQLTRPPAPRIRRFSVGDAEEQIRIIEKRAELMRVATIKLTTARDWVKMGTDAFLMNVGMQRIAAAWQIRVHRFAPEDFARETLEEGHVLWTVIISGHSDLTGEETTEIGTRSTMGKFFEKKWKAAGPAGKQEIIYTAKKACLANARGRLIGGLTGMRGLSCEYLASKGLDPSKMRDAEFTEGGEGGRGVDPNQANDGQRFKLAALACKEQRVEHMTAGDLERTVETLKGCDLPKKACSALIDRLQKCTKAKPMPAREFWKAAGWAKAEPDPGGGGGGGSKASAASSAGAPFDPKTQECPECLADPERIRTEGHASGCSLGDVR